MDLHELAARIVADHFPTVRAAVLAGSAGAGRATSRSDLDIVVVLDGPPAPYRETQRVEGRTVELFVHTDESIAFWFDRERTDGIGTLAHMLATGTPIAGDDVAIIQRHAAEHLAAGPPTWTSERVDYRRYLITDGLDDLADAVDVDERDAIAGQLVTMTAELALAVTGSWQGRGKQLVRRLRESDPDLATDLYAAHRDAVATGARASLTAVCERVLELLGGRLTEGFVVR